MASKELQSQLEHMDYSRNVIHEYSPGVQKLFDLARAYVHDAEEKHRNGQSVIWTWGIWEAPLVYACGTIPVAFTELGRLASQQALTLAEDYFQLPREACSMVKTTLGEWQLRKGGINRILGMAAGCEPYNLATELMKGEGYDTHYIDTVYLPPKFEPERYNQVLSFFVDELRRAGRWISGQDVDEDKMAVEIRRRNRVVQKVRRIMELRRGNHLYVRSLPAMFLAAGSGHYFGKPDEYEGVLDAIIGELEAVAADGTAKPEAIPLVWSGGRGQEFGVYQTIDEAGGAILGWVIPTPFARNYREDVPPLEALARYYLDGQLAGASIFRRRVIEEQVKLTKARGIVLYGYVGCSFSGIDREMHREYFHKQGIPSITLEGSFQVGPPSGQLVTRVRAFVEMLSWDPKI